MVEKNHHSAKKLKLFGLVLLIFYGVSGGPFGLELVVQAGGPLYALLGFSLLFVWAIPEALITAELATALPESSGSVAWVSVAFGPFWAFLDGFLSWVSGVVDNALYPVLFIDCLVHFVNVNDDILCIKPYLVDTYPRFALIMTITALLTFLTYRGLDIVSGLAVLLCFLSLSPFIVFCCVGVFYIKPSRWLAGPTLPDGTVGTFKDVNWSVLLNTFFWNINYWESSAAFSGDVENPGVLFPRGMAIAVGLVIVSGFFPILIGTGATDASSQEWTDGYFVRLSGEIGGTWLALWMILAAALSNIGMFVAEMSSDAWMVAGMADRGIIPKVLGQRNAHGTPTFGIMLSATGVIFLSFLSFIDIVDMLNLIFCISQAIEFAAFLYLRAYRSDIHRPYKIPLNLACLCTMLSLPTIFIGVIVYFSSPSCLILSSSVLIIAVLLYYLLEYAREKKLCEFVPYHSYHEPGYICPNEHFDANDVGMLQHMEQQDTMQSNLLPSNSNSDYGSMKHVELHGMNSSAYIADDAVELESESELEEAPNALFMYIQKYMYE